MSIRFLVNLDSSSGSFTLPKSPPSGGEWSSIKLNKSLYNQSPSASITNGSGTWTSSTGATFTVTSSADPLVYSGSSSLTWTYTAWNASAQTGRLVITDSSGNEFVKNWNGTIFVAESGTQDFTPPTGFAFIGAYTSGDPTPGTTATNRFLLLNFEECENNGYYTNSSGAVIKYCFSLITDQTDIEVHKHHNIELFKNTRTDKLSITVTDANGTPTITSSNYIILEFELNCGHKLSY